MTSKCWTEVELRAALDRYESELRAAGKARNTVTTYVQHPERFINWLVGRYDTGSAAIRNQDQGHVRTSKYDSLRTHLAERHEAVVQMTFKEIEAVIGRSLPPSARKYRPWWANEQSGTHVHARAWLDARRRTGNVDLEAGSVEFIR